MKSDDLINKIMKQNARDLSYTTNAVIDSLTRENDVLTATLRAIRDGLEGMLAERYTPQPNVLRSALYPTEHQITWYLDLMRTEKDGSLDFKKEDKNDNIAEPGSTT